MSKNSEIISNIKEIALKHAQEQGYEVVDVDYKIGNKHDLLSIYIFRKEGIDLDDCSNMSKAIEEDLDNMDLLKNPYYLEISSPGLDRPIKTSDDYRRNLNNEVTIKLYTPIDNKKQIEGKLIGYDSEKVQIELEDKTIELPIKSISLMVQTIRF